MCTFCARRFLDSAHYVIIIRSKGQSCVWWAFIGKRAVLSGVGLFSRMAGLAKRMHSVLVRRVVRIRASKSMSKSLEARPDVVCMNSTAAARGLSCSMAALADEQVYTVITIGYW